MHFGATSVCAVLMMCDSLQSLCQGANMSITICRDLEEALEMGMDWSLREGVLRVCLWSLREGVLRVCLCMCAFTLFCSWLGFQS